MSGAFNVTYTAGGRFDPPFMPTKTRPYTKGNQMELPGAIMEQVQEVIFPFDVELVSIAVGASKYQARDYWELYIGDDPVPLLETIYTKDLPEGNYLMAVVPIEAGTKITFKFMNESGSAKFVWFNLQCLRDE